MYHFSQNQYAELIHTLRIIQDIVFYCLTSSHAHTMVENLMHTWDEQGTHRQIENTRIGMWC